MDTISLEKIQLFMVQQRDVEESKVQQKDVEKILDNMTNTIQQIR